MNQAETQKPKYEVTGKINGKLMVALEAWQILQPWPCISRQTLVESICSSERHFPAFCTLTSCVFTSFCLQTEGLNMSLCEIKLRCWSAALLQEENALECATCWGKWPERKHPANLSGSDSSCLPFSMGLMPWVSQMTVKYWRWKWIEVCGDLWWILESHCFLSAQECREPCNPSHLHHRD